MKIFLVPLIILLPLFYSLIFSFIKSEDKRRQFSLISFTSLILILGFAGAFIGPSNIHFIDVGLEFNVDTESFALAFFYTLIILLSQYFLPKYSHETLLTPFLLVNTSLNYGLLFSNNLKLILFFFITSLIPTAIYIRKNNLSSRMFLIFNSISLIILSLGFLILSQEGVLSTELKEISKIVHHNQYTMAGSLLILIGVMIREGIFPFHSWLRAFIGNTNINYSLSFIFSHAGFMIFYKLVMPLLGHELSGVILAFTVCTIFTSLYFAGLGLVETELNYIFAAIFCSESAVIMSGFELHNKVGLYGSLFEWMALTISIGGFGIILYLLKKRAGITNIKHHLGLFSKTPKLAVFFLLFGLFSVGLPAGMGFIGEDLLIHGIVEHYPFLGLIIVVAISFNGINIYRIYNRLFLGETPSDLYCDDLKNRESFYFISILMVLVFLGLMPFLLLKKDFFNTQFLN
jgi:NADH-quinone oxidoreductase subunit M